jgi:hypothetical protein
MGGNLIHCIRNPIVLHFAKPNSKHHPPFAQKSAQRDYDVVMNCDARKGIARIGG